MDDPMFVLLGGVTTCPMPYALGWTDYVPYALFPKPYALGWTAYVPYALLMPYLCPIRALCPMDDPMFVLLGGVTT